ncbi:PAS domain-containing protein [Spirulina sp. CCNP1310]|uniref:PAS domain-containing protein n=1 Tax=Spirulina sp. CCNP1310 TaxID=3110249 RepID=UPI002B1EFEAC|nr:PAS domain-containing protein [Spirulina sp. CCNP1310]MEA5418195.1 PAS domain-containing protein [Spirulina sp. CCNP1310]
MPYPRQISPRFQSHQPGSGLKATAATETAGIFGGEGEDNPAFQSLFNASLDGLLIANDQGEYIAANPVACELFGLPASAIVGQSIQDFVSLELDFEQTWRQFLAAGKSEGEFSLLRGEGDRRLIQYTATAHFLPHLHLSILRDITPPPTDQPDDRNPNSELTDGQYRLQQIAHHVPGALYQFSLEPDGSMSFPYASEGIRQIYGISPETVQEDCQNVFSVIHPDDFDRVSESIMASAAQLTPWRCEYRVNHPDGQQLWLLGYATPQRQKHGGTTWYGYIRDITTEKINQLALQASENKLRNIIENINDMLFIADQNANFSYVSPTFKTVMGYELTDLSQRPFADVVHPEDLSICVQSFNAVLRGERVQGLEYRVLHADGQYYWHRANLAPLQEGPDQGIVCLGLASYIDDRKQAEIALRESKARLDFLLEGVGDGVWEWHLQTNAVIYSREWLLLLGCRAEELTNTTADWDSRLHPEDREQAYADMSRYLQGETPMYESEHRLRHADGSYQWMLSRGRILERDEEGRPLRFIGLFSDISVRKQAQLELEQFFNVGLELLCIADVEGNFRRLNQAWSRTLGYDLAELEGQPFLNFVHPDDLDSTLAAIAHLGDQNNIASFVNRYQAKNGEYRYIEWSSAPHADLIYAAARDITARLETEAALKALVQRSQLLNEISTEVRNSLNLETIVQNTVNAIVAEVGVDICTFGWYEADREPPEWNVIMEQRQPEMTSWLGAYQLSEFPLLFEHIFAGQTYQLDVENTTDEFLKAFCQEVKVDLYFMLPIHTAGGKIGAFEMGRVGRDRPWQPDEMELLHSIGNQVAIAIYQAQLYQESQSKSEELEQAYRELQETQIQLIQAEKMSSLGQLVAGIAHEINNPVSFIYGNLTHTANYAHDLLELIHLYQSHYPDPPGEIIELMEDVDLEFIASDLPKTLDSMQTGAARIRDIIKSLRTFSRLDEADLKEIDIHENLDSTLVILQNRTNGRSGMPEIYIEKNYGPLPLVECYGGLLNQVFMNLLANAIDAIHDRQYSSAPGSAEPDQGRIKIHTTCLDGEQVAIAIQDNGIGITPDIQGKIFNPFFTTKPIGTGTGMGLSTSYQIITNTHRGRLYCTSTPGMGSTFTLKLPLHHPLS